MGAGKSVKTEPPLSRSSKPSGAEPVLDNEICGRSKTCWGLTPVHRLVLLHSCFSAAKRLSAFLLLANYSVISERPEL